MSGRQSLPPSADARPSEPEGSISRCLNDESPGSLGEPKISNRCEAHCISCAIDAAGKSNAPVDPATPSSSRLPPRPFHHDLPSEAITLWGSDLKNAFLGMHMPGEKPPLLWVECLDGYLEQECYQVWRSYLGKQPWTTACRREMSLRARRQAQDILYWHERLYEEGPALGLLPTTRLLSLQDYGDTPLCASPEGMVASAAVMSACGFRMMRESELDDGTYTLYTPAKRFSDNRRCKCALRPFDRVRSQWAGAHDVALWRWDVECWCSGDSEDDDSLCLAEEEPVKEGIELFCTSRCMEAVELPESKVHRLLRSMSLEEAVQEAAPENEPALALAAAVLGAFLGSLRLGVHNDLKEVRLNGSAEPLDVRMLSPCIGLSTLSPEPRVYVPPARPYSFENRPLPAYANTLWPADLQSVISIMPGADNAAFWSSTLRDCLFREEDVCRRLWEKECRGWNNPRSASARDAMRQMARDQAISVMQGLCTLLELGPLIGTRSHPGPHVFRSPAEDESTPVSWAFWPPEDDAEFGTLPYEPRFFDISGSAASADRFAELAKVTPAALAAAIQHLQWAQPSVEGIPAATASVRGWQLEESPPLSLIPELKKRDDGERFKDRKKKKAKGKQAKAAAAQTEPAEQGGLADTPGNDPTTGYTFEHGIANLSSCLLPVLDGILQQKPAWRLGKEMKEEVISSLKANRASLNKHPVLECYARKPLPMTSRPAESEAEAALGGEPSM